MRHRPRRLFVLFLKLAVWAMCLAVFLVCLSAIDRDLLALNRTSAVVALTFTLIYVLMQQVYGGFDVGTRKSRTIAFAQGLALLFSDLAGHLFLCIMDYTDAAGGRFVYEKPLLILAALAAQAVVVTGMAYLGNGLYFHWKKPQRVLLIARRDGDWSSCVGKIASFRKQYTVEEVAFVDDDGMAERIERADAVFFHDLTEAERAGLVEQCYRRQKDVYYTLGLTDVMSLGGKLVYFDDTTMLFAEAEKLSVEDRLLKRIMDIVIALVGLIVTSPLLLAAAIAIKAEDGGPVFYRQTRATLGGKPFEIIKFRSMRPEVGDEHRSVTDGDARITRVGRALRRFRIDELPQFLNVLAGDMSVVGPRPEMLENVERYTRELPEFAYRLQVKAGMTGYAQVYGRYNTTPKDKMILDLLYIENYSIWFDIKIILRTMLVFLTPERSTAAFRRDEDGE